MSRTMMLAELATLFTATTPETTRKQYVKVVVDENRLGKRTNSNRRLTARHLIDLYGLDPSLAIFRLLRFFWSIDQRGQPLMAFLCAYSRDSLLRLSASFVLNSKSGDILTTEQFIEFFNQATPDRFSSGMVKSLSQNVASSWTHAGFLKGRRKKIRQHPVISSAVTAYALVLGYLNGLRGQILLESDWARLLDVPRDQVIHFAQEASKRGWLDFKGAGNVFEINFRQILTPQEIKVSHGAN